MISRRLVSLFLITFAFVGAAQSQPTKSVEIKGVPPKTLGELKTRFPTVFSNQVKIEDLENFIRALYATGLFESVEWSNSAGSEARYTVSARAVRTIADIVISGNSVFSRSEILGILKINTGDRLDRSLLEDAARTLKDRYGESGYVNAELEMSFDTNANGDYIVKVHIKEGRVCTIQSIEFNTPNTELQNALKSLTSNLKKKPLRQETVVNAQQSIVDYLSENRFLTATVSAPEYKFNDARDSVVLSFNVERPFRFAILFEGNTVFSSSDLVKEMNLNSQTAFGLSQASDLASRIEQTYRKRGYGNVNVTYTEKVFNQDYIRQINFVISEGVRTRVGAIKVGGNITRPESYYVELIKNNGSRLTASGYYNKEDMSAAVDAAVIDLQNQGYLRAKSQSVRAEFTSNKAAVAVYVQLDEGPLTRVKAIQFTGNTSIPSAELAKVINLQPGAPLKLTGLDKSIEDLKAFYLSRSYLDMIIENEKEGLVQYNTSGTEASLNFQIHEGPPVRVGSIAIEGLTFTKEDVVKKELEFSPGDSLTPDKINDSLYRLQRLSLFSTTEISTLEVGTDISERTVVVRLSERDPGFFSSGLGLSSEFELTTRGYLGLSYRNLGGTARALSGRVEVKKIMNLDFIDHQLSAGYLEPYIFNTRTRGRANLTRSVSLISRLGGLDNAIENNQLELLLERDITRHVKLTWNFWSISFLRNFELQNKTPETKQTIATVGPTLEWDYRDNPFVTRDGHYTRLNVEYSDPNLGSSAKVQFVRATAGYNYYWPIFAKHVIWAHSLRGGYVANLFPDSEIPQSKRFYLGGRSTLRGFDVASVPGLLAEKDGADAVDNLPRVRTDSHFYLYKSEFRIPIYGDFEGVLFYDGGAVRISGHQFQDEYRDAAGLGFRYMTPVGAVSAEYGFKLDRHENESEGRFDFAIGTF